MGTLISTRSAWRVVRYLVLVCIALASCNLGDEHGSPTVSELSPNHGPVGNRFNIWGSNFEEGDIVVYFGAKRVRPFFFSPTLIRVVVPQGAKRSNITLRAGGREIKAGEFVVTYFNKVRWRQVDHGGLVRHHACGLLNNGSLWCWGDNSSLQLGTTPNSDDEKFPVKLEGEWSSVTVPDYFMYGNTCGILNNSDAVCWGDNKFGPLPATAGNTVERPTSLSGKWSRLSLGSSLACGSKSDASLYCWSRAPTDSALKELSEPQKMGIGQWSSFEVGNSHACGIQNDGSLWCWGLNDSGQLGTGSAQPATAPVRVGADSDWALVAAAGALRVEQSKGEYLGIQDGHSCAIKTNGSLWCWGGNHDFELGSIGGNQMLPTRVGNASDYSYVAASSNRTCAIKQDSSLWCWGDNKAEQVQFDATVKWKTVALGANLCGLDIEGLAWCMKSNCKNLFDCSFEAPKAVTEFVVP